MKQYEIEVTLSGYVDILTGGYDTPNYSRVPAHCSGVLYIAADSALEAKGIADSWSCLAECDDLDDAYVEGVSDAWRMPEDIDVTEPGIVDVKWGGVERD